MTERERLIKLLNDVSSAQYEGDIIVNSEMDIDTSEMNRIADYLLANGVIIPPCKVGDAVYILAGPFGKKYEQDVCVGFYIGDNGVPQVRTRNKKGNHGTYGIIGETVFLTKEEAEKAVEDKKKE